MSTTSGKGQPCHWRKDQLLEICPVARLGGQSWCRRLSVADDMPIVRGFPWIGIRTHLLFTIFAEQADTLSRSANFYFQMNGGAYRDRTDDPLLAKQMLSQLS